MPDVEQTAAAPNKKLTKEEKKNRNVNNSRVVVAEGREEVSGIHLGS